jgi:hypothetical protein
MPHAFTSVANQPQDRSLGDSIATTKISSRRAGPILSYQALDRLSRQPLTDPTFLVTAVARTRTPLVVVRAGEEMLGAVTLDALIDRMLLT